MAAIPMEAAVYLEYENADHPSVPSLPDPDGRAGMAAGLISSEDGISAIMAAGGANFPNGLPWHGGEKRYHTDIFSLREGAWQKICNLPVPLAYSAFAATSHGLVIAGGASTDRHVKDTFLLRPSGRIIPLPALPETLAYPAFGSRNNRIYVLGGQETPNSQTALRSVYMLDLSSWHPEKKDGLIWKRLPDIPGSGRMLATAGIDGSRMYLFGGVSLSPGEDDSIVRTYLDEVLVFDTAREKWLTEKTSMPYPLAGTPAPLPAREGRIFLPGGDTGGHYGKPPQTHPGQSSEVLAFHPRTGNWSSEGNWAQGLATAPVISDANVIVSISGETRPGVRTPHNYMATWNYEGEFNIVDYIIPALLSLLLALIFFQIRRTRASLNHTNRLVPVKSGRYAWVVVGLLWFVAMLNYFDRQLLTAIREPVIRDIPQTEMQFGMLTGVFLMIYSLLSPVGGFLADRYSRLLVILASLVVWSVVTWLTGHVQDYNTLLAARALMGISEACYIPAALALITDYHRGKTRSLATGIHMSGIYAGMALAGWGGDMADAYGWRLTFALFGLVGVGYALILILFLKEPTDIDDGKPDSAHSSMEKERPLSTPGKGSMGMVFRHILSSKAMWMLMCVVACAGAANWFLLAWFPTLLQEKFNLSLGDAGRNATLWSTLAKYIAVLAGAVLADWWSVRNVRGRSLLPGIIFCLSGPFIALSPFIPSEIAGALAILLIFVATQGFAQGTLDATLMPVMRSHIGGRYAATGYGFLNFVSAGFGAFTVIYGGRLKDTGIPLDTTLAYTGGLLFTGGILLLLLPRPGSNNEI